MYKKNIHYLLYTRPYSIMDFSLSGILGYALYPGFEALTFTLIMVVIVSSLLWMAFNLLNESIQKDKYRKHIPIIVPILLFITAIIIYITNFNFNWYLILLILSFLVYSLKHRYVSLTKYIYFIRGLNSIFLFLMFLNIDIYEYNLDIFYILLLLFFSQSYRSFIGDFRDIKNDNYTFVALYSIKTSKVVLFIIGLISTYFAFLISAYLGMFVFSCILFSTIKYLQINNDKIDIMSYSIHQYAIISTYFMQLFLILNTNVDIMYFISVHIIIALAIVLCKTYGLVIRPINKEIINESYI